MKKKLYEHKVHESCGRFGDNEALRAEYLYQHINDILAYGEGYKLSPRPFVTNEIGVTDTKLIKGIIKRMFEYCHISFDEKQKDLYYSYLYCAIALFSVEFEYYEEDEGACYDFPERAQNQGIALDFMSLIKNSDVTTRNGSPSFVYSNLVLYMNDLYYLLSGESKLDVIRPMIEGANDPNDGIIDKRFVDEPEDDWYNYPNPEELYMPDPELLDERVVKERNTLSTKKLKLMYPGYKDYVKMMDQMLDSFINAASNRFHDDIHELINGYMLCEGKCIYVSEEDYTDVMVHLNRAIKLLKKSVK